MSVYQRGTSMAYAMRRLRLDVMHVSDIGRAAEFWGRALESQYKLVHRDHNSATFFPRNGEGVAFQLTERNQMHLDLNTDSPEENAAEIKRLESLGARRVAFAMISRDVRNYTPARRPTSWGIRQVADFDRRASEALRMATIAQIDQLIAAIEAGEQDQSDAL